ncbi:hypothetical protein PR048_024860 [Dryococelus australis]|uniref:Uncharacterized protein n=1 Tax=Dryococelus australis TaxID=614101 RepID=A0ABQ9GPR4_9NEOP|nr:hypothetical protein PR048_024860 [Dryococelus australis]
MQWRGKREILEKISRLAESPNTIPTCENTGATPPGIEPGYARLGLHPSACVPSVTGQLTGNRSKSSLRTRVPAHAASLVERHAALGFRQQYQQLVVFDNTKFALKPSSSNASCSLTQNSNRWPQSPALFEWLPQVSRCDATLLVAADTWFQKAVEMVRAVVNTWSFGQESGDLAGQEISTPVYTTATFVTCLSMATILRTISFFTCSIFAPSSDR